jgi:hypothetical protein
VIAVQYIATAKDEGSSVFNRLKHEIIFKNSARSSLYIHHKDKLVKTAGGNNAFVVKILQNP